MGYQALIKYTDKLYLIDHTPSIDFSFTIESVETLPVQFTTLTFYLDQNRVKGELRLMRGKLRDSFVPLGMNSAKTVNAMLKDKGIPAFQRVDWPVLCIDNQLIGIPGVSLNRAFNPHPSLPSYLKVTFEAC
jgi:tRNA(Ile)-lysidine synthetase-like protein